MIEFSYSKRRGVCALLIAYAIIELTLRQANRGDKSCVDATDISPGSIKIATKRGTQGDSSTHLPLPLSKLLGVKKFRARHYLFAPGAVSSPVRKLKLEPCHLAQLTGRPLCVVLPSETGALVSQGRLCNGQKLITISDIV